VKIRIAYTVFMLVLAVACSAGRVSAQQIEIAWSPATNISNTPASSNRPTIVADAAGNVHVVWARMSAASRYWASPTGSLGRLNTLLYTCWDGSTWSEPTDFVFVPGDSLAEYPSLALAPTRSTSGLDWTGNHLLQPRARARRRLGSCLACPGRRGSSARTSFESTVAVDDQNTVHILHATRGVDPEVLHVSIVDGGLGIMTSTRLSSPLRPPDEVAFLNVSLKIDPKGRLHALWGTVREDGFGQAIYYARSLDGGQTWRRRSPAGTGQKRPSQRRVPSFGIAGDSELHVIYCYPANMARQERISQDAGETWGESHTSIPTWRALPAPTFRSATARATSM